jgi:hypothetical protein
MDFRDGPVVMIELVRPGAASVASTTRGDTSELLSIKGSVKSKPISGKAAC